MYTKIDSSITPLTDKAHKEIEPLDIETVKLNEQADDELVNELHDLSIPVDSQRFEHAGVPKQKTTPKHQDGHDVYPRDRNVAINAFSYADYKCEIDNAHPTFIRKTTGLPYTEPHHLVPMAFSEMFDVSLDVEENVVSLCSNCHNEIHYGRDAGVLLKALYAQRKGALKNAGIEITLSELLKMYGAKIF